MDSKNITHSIASWVARWYHPQSPVRTSGRAPLGHPSRRPTQLPIVDRDPQMQAYSPFLSSGFMMVGGRTRLCKSERGAVQQQEQQHPRHTHFSSSPQTHPTRLRQTWRL